MSLTPEEISKQEIQLDRITRGCKDGIDLCETADGVDMVISDFYLWAKIPCEALGLDRDEIFKPVIEKGEKAKVDRMLPRIEPATKSKRLFAAICAKNIQKSPILLMAEGLRKTNK